jgi:hypothetical protein
LPEIQQEIVRSLDLSDYFCIIQMSQRFFSMLNPFLHSKMDFKKQKNNDLVQIYVTRFQLKKSFPKTVRQPLLFVISLCISNV